MSPPKHILSAAAIVLNDNNELLLIKGPRRGWGDAGWSSRRRRVLKSSCNTRN